MTSAIDITKPVFGNPTTQSVRDNFSHAHDEITDLQNKTTGAPFLPINGGTMNGPIQLQTDPLNPLEVTTKRYVDNLAFGTAGGIPDALADGMAYARMNVTGGMAWSTNPLFQSAHFGTTSNDYFHIGFDATYDLLFADANNNALRFNRSTGNFELVTNNIVAQSWNATATTITNFVATNSASVSGNSPTLNLTSPSAANEYIYLNTGTTKRWALGADAAATGFGIFRYDTSGVVVDKPFAIDRVNGYISINSLVVSPTVAGLWPNITLDGLNTVEKALIGTVNGKSRWSIILGDRATEDASNGGSNFYLSRYDNAGNYIDYVLAANRQVGSVNVGRAQYTSVFDGKGNLGLGRNVPAGQGVANSNNGGWFFGWGLTADNWVSNMYYDGTNWRYIFNGAAWGAVLSDNAGGFQVSRAPNGTAGNIATSTYMMRVDTSGNLFLPSNVNCTDVQASGGGYFQNEVWGTNVRATSGLFYVSSGNYMQQSGGTWVWTYNATQNMVMQLDGVLISRNGYFTMGANQPNNYVHGIQTDGAGNRSYKYNGDTYRLYWDINTGSSTFILNGQWVWNMRNDYITGNTVSYVFGKGAYADWSDDRTKRDSSKTNIGLAEVLKIDPIKFIRIQNLREKDVDPERSLYIPIDRQEIGFSAQQLRTAIPEAVVELGLELPDGTGGQNSDDPTLGITTTAIVAALVNGMKELNSRLITLEGKA